MGINPIHWLIVLTILAFIFSIAFAIPLIAFKFGRKLGDQAGYIRGFKEGQQSRT